MSSTPDLNGRPSPVMGESTNNNTQSVADYLAQLLKDKKRLKAFPNVFLHAERLLDDEISKVRGNLFQINGQKPDPLLLPDALGPSLMLSEKVYVPVKEYPEFNFVGRILGPRGMTTKQLEQETGCKIMVRGKGSMRDKKKEDQNRGKPNWEHLNDELHVLITVEDTENRAHVKIQRAKDEVKKLLIVSEGEDELKKRQLMELAIINGTYRDSQSKQTGCYDTAQSFLLNNHTVALQNMVNQQNALRTAVAAAGGPLSGAPLILSHHRLQIPPTSAVASGLGSAGGNAAVTGAGLLNGSLVAASQPSQAAPLLATAGDTSGLLYAQYAAAAANADFAAAANFPAGLVSPLVPAEYATDPCGGPSGGKDRRNQLNGNQTIRVHPYSRN